MDTNVDEFGCRPRFVASLVQGGLIRWNVLVGVWRMLDILSLTHYQLWPQFQRQVDPMKNLFKLFVQGHMILVKW